MAPPTTPPPRVGRQACARARRARPFSVRSSALAHRTQPGPQARAKAPSALSAGALRACGGRRGAPRAPLAARAASRRLRRAAGALPRAPRREKRAEGPPRTRRPPAEIGGLGGFRTTLPLFGLLFFFFWRRPVRCVFARAPAARCCLFSRPSRARPKVHATAVLSWRRARLRCGAPWQRRSRTRSRAMCAGERRATATGAPSGHPGADAAPHPSRRRVQGPRGRAAAPAPRHHP